MRLTCDPASFDRANLDAPALPVCHPTTSTNLANRASALLDRVTVHASRTGSTLPLVGAEDVYVELEKLGGKRAEEREKTPVPADSKGKGKAREQEQEQEREGRPIEREEQRAGVVRLMSVVQGLAGTR